LVMCYDTLSSLQNYVCMGTAFVLKEFNVVQQNSKSVICIKCYLLWFIEIFYKSYTLNKYNPNSSIMKN